MNPKNFNSYLLIKDLLLRDTFCKLSMVIIEKRKPSPEDISRCVHFSVTARLPPRWNQVGHFFIRNQDFLDIAGDSASYKAVKLKIEISGCYHSISITANIFQNRTSYSFITLFNDSIQ